MNPEPLPTRSAAAHLSDGDLDEILMGIAEPPLSAHAAACALCAGRLEAFQQSVGLFNQASLAWSQAKSNTLTRDLTAHRPRPVLTLAAACSYGAATLVAAALMLTAGVHHHDLTIEAANRPAVIDPAATDTLQQEIASDNAMLEAIDSELYRPEPLPAALSEDAQIGAQIGIQTSPRRSASRQARN